MGWAQAFGRFGYSQSVQVPGIKVDREGFVALDPLADKIRFLQPAKSWQPTATSQVEQVVALTPSAWGPSKLGFNLLGPGFTMYFPEGIDLKVGTIGSPYLSWQQGTVGDGIPTPEVRWLILSFRDKQPPFVIGFLDNPSSLIITGSPGSWNVKSPKGFKGWIKVGLPEGLNSQLANTASALGQLSQDVVDNESIWINRAPKLIKTEIEADLASVTATWRFDRSGAVVPPPALLANLGNYRLSIKSKTRRLPGWTEEGPTEVSVGEVLSIRFPIKRVPTGRSLALGSQLSDPIGTVSSFDIPSVANLALESLVAGRDVLTRKSAEEADTEFISQTAFFPEPWTQQQLPYNEAGVGMDLAAAHSFLSQATTATSKASSEANSMLTSVSWRQDWINWRAWTHDQAIAQRTGALAALAGALCPEPERRLTAAMFQAGLSGLRGLNVWKRRKGIINDEPKLIEPLYGVRKGIFGMEGPVEDGETFALSLLSSMRVFSEQSVGLVKQGPDYILQWAAVEAKASVITLATSYPIDATAHTNLRKFKAEGALGFTEFHYVPETAGICEIKIVIPDFAKPPIPVSRVPAYSDALR